MKYRLIRLSLRYLSTFVLLVMHPCHSASAANTPMAEQLQQSGTPIYGDLALANHVFGYRFQVLEPGRIKRLGGYFSGVKEVIVINATNDIVASASVSGDAAKFKWSELATPLRVEAGQIFRVLVRTGSDQSSAAAWSVSMPFTQDAIQVLSLEQGWSSSSDPQVWIHAAQTLSEQHARGLVDIHFSPDGESEQLAGDTPIESEENPAEVPFPASGDPYPDTVGVVDSFGQADPSGRLGMGFMAVGSYYRDFPRQRGECPQSVHDRYWVKDANGVSHPTWHPPVDPVTGCRFAHEHGDDPRLSPNYSFAEGIPFGITHGGSAGFMRHEDHVGHKIIVQTGWGLVDGNPQNGIQPDSGFIRRTGINCDWLSKIHQGSWSRDALANNAHEYFLNLRCTDGVQMRLKQLITFGPPELVTNICDNPVVNEDDALGNPDQTSQAFHSGVASTSGVAVTQALDGKREFACIKNVRWKDTLEELWKSDGVLEFPGGGFINFSPYYVVLNPARYMNHQWAVRGAVDSYISSLDLCFDDNAAYQGLPMRFCNSVPAELGELNSAVRQRDLRNPMNGTRRVIHPKNIVLYTANEAGSERLITFCTNRLGRDVRVLESGACAENEIEQLVSRSDRRQWGWNGSDVNAINIKGQLRGAGYLNEWVRDFSAPGIRFPN